MAQTPPSVSAQLAKPAIAESPLAEARPDSLQSYFSMDPLHLTRQDRDVIVAELRRMREKWKTEEQSGATKSRAAKAPTAPKKPAPPQLSLKDLGLE